MSADSLRGRFLLADPTMPDPRFAKAVVFMCEHSHEGAMGLVINRRNGKLSFQNILDELSITPQHKAPDRLVYHGGPVDLGRGFVLHSRDYDEPDRTMHVTDHIALSATQDVLMALAKGQGPEKSLVALGYTGWGPGQLDSELAGNGWMVADADPDLMFGTDENAKWSAVLAAIGIDARMLSSQSGRA